MLLNPETGLLCIDFEWGESLYLTATAVGSVLEVILFANCLLAGSGSIDCKGQYS